MNKRLNKITKKDIAQDLYMQQEMISKNSSMWFLNSHRLASLEKILAAYLSNYREFCDVLCSSSESIAAKCVIFDTQNQNFSDVLSFYQLLRGVCKYQN